MPAQRKLFIAHAGELAHRLARTMSRDGGAAGMAPDFLRAYGQRFDRAGVFSNPTRFLDMQYNITREALLVAAVDIRPRLAQAFAQSRGHRVQEEDAALAESFFAEFRRSLSHALDWRPAEEGAEQESFCGDLELYQRWTGRPASRSETRQRAAAPGSARTPEESPFPDRCALLLDPAMMEQARRACVEFEREILRGARHIFGQLGAVARTAPRPRRPAVARPRPRGNARPPRSATRRRSKSPHGRKVASRAAARPRTTLPRRATAKRKRAPRRKTVSLTAARPRARSPRRAKSHRAGATRKRARSARTARRPRTGAASRRARAARRRRR